MFGLFKFTSVMIKCFLAVPVTAGKVAGDAIGAGIVATGVIKNKKSGSDMEKEERSEDSVHEGN